MHSVCRCSLLVWRRSFLKNGNPVIYFCPALDPPLGGSGRKTTTLVRDHEYFIPNKFHQNQFSSSGEEVENVKSLRTDGRRRRCAMTIAHSSLRLRWAKNEQSLWWSFLLLSFSNFQFCRHWKWASWLSYPMQLVTWKFRLKWHNELHGITKWNKHVEILGLRRRGHTCNSAIHKYLGV